MEPGDYSVPWESNSVLSGLRLYGPPAVPPTQRHLVLPLPLLEGAEKYAAVLRIKQAPQQQPQQAPPPPPPRHSRGVVTVRPPQPLPTPTPPPPLPKPQRYDDRPWTTEDVFGIALRDLAWRRAANTPLRPGSRQQRATTASDQIVRRYGTNPFERTAPSLRLPRAEVAGAAPPVPAEVGPQLGLAGGLLRVLPRQSPEDLARSLAQAVYQNRPNLTPKPSVPPPPPPLPDPALAEAARAAAKAAAKAARQVAARARAVAKMEAAQAAAKTAAMQAEEEALATQEPIAAPAAPVAIAVSARAASVAQSEGFGSVLDSVSEAGTTDAAEAASRSSSLWSPRRSEVAVVQGGRRIVWQDALPPEAMPERRPRRSVGGVMGTANRSVLKRKPSMVKLKFRDNTFGAVVTHLLRERHGVSSAPLARWRRATATIIRAMRRVWTLAGGPTRPGPVALLAAMRMTARAPALGPAQPGQTSQAQPADFEQASYREQGDDWYYTEEAMRRRLELVGDEGVRRACKLWWGTVSKVPVPEGEERPAMVDRLGYCQMNVKIQRALTQEKFQLEEVLACAEDDWAEDSGGQTLMGEEAFNGALFQLADVWVDSVEAEDYCQFLLALLWHIAVCPPWPPVAWREDRTIRRLRMDEVETFKEPQGHAGTAEARATGQSRSAKAAASPAKPVRPAMKQPALRQAPLSPLRNYAEWECASKPASRLSPRVVAPTAEQLLVQRAMEGLRRAKELALTAEASFSSGGGSGAGGGGDGAARPEGIAEFMALQRARAEMRSSEVCSAEASSRSVAFRAAWRPAGPPKPNPVVFLGGGTGPTPTPPPPVRRGLESMLSRDEFICEEQFVAAQAAAALLDAEDVKEAEEELTRKEKGRIATRAAEEMRVRRQETLQLSSNSRDRAAASPKRPLPAAVDASAVLALPASTGRAALPSSEASQRLRFGDAASTLFEASLRSAAEDDWAPGGLPFVPSLPPLRPLGAKPGAWLAYTRAPGGCELAGGVRLLGAGALAYRPSHSGAGLRLGAWPREKGNSALVGSTFS